MALRLPKARIEPLKDENNLYAKCLVRSGICAPIEVSARQAQIDLTEMMSGDN